MSGSCGKCGHDLCVCKTKDYPHCDVCDSGGIAAEDCPNCHWKVAEWYKQMFALAAEENKRLRGFISEHAQAHSLHMDGTAAWRMTGSVPGRWLSVFDAIGVSVAADEE